VSGNSDEVVDEPSWQVEYSARDDSTQDWAWPDRTLAHVVPEVNPSVFISGELYSIQEHVPKVGDTGCSSFCEIDGYQLHCRPLESEVNRKDIQSDLVIEEVPGLKFNLNLPEFGFVFTPEMDSRSFQSPCPSEIDRVAVLARGVISYYDEGMNSASFPIPCRENTSSETEYRHSKSATQPIAKVNREFLREEFESEFIVSEGRSSSPIARVESRSLQVEFEAQSVSSDGGSSCSSRKLNFRSLRRRLPLKYSRSLVDDVLYVLEFLALSGSSALSSRIAEGD